MTDGKRVWTDRNGSARGNTRAPARWLAWGMMSGLLLGGLQGRAESYSLATTEHPPAIDGRLDDAAWTRATVLDRFVVLGGGEPAGEGAAATRALLTADAKALYVAIHCGETQIGKLSQRHRGRDEPVWQDDDVEIFLVPGGADARAYIQLAVNPAGALMDAWIPEPKAPLDLSYDSGAEVRAHIGADHWAVEMRLPLARIPAETVSGAWRLHVARARRTTGEYLTCLQAPVSGFHEIGSFAELQGIDKLCLPFALHGFSVGTLGYGRNTCRFEVAGRKEALTAASVEVDGVIRAQFDTAALQIMTGVLQLPFALTPDDRERTLTIQTYAADRVVQRRDIALNTLPEALLTQPERSVFFFYHNAPVVLDLPLHMDPGEQSLRLMWTARTPDGRELGSGLTSPAPPWARVRLYWQDWQPGPVDLEWKLVLDDRELERGECHLRLVKNPWEAGQ